VRSRRASYPSFASLSGAATVLRVLKWLPWVVFGPITGFLLDRAVVCFRRNDWLLGVGYVVLNLGILLIIPLATAKLASRL
jgi:hypothetical protein